MSMTARWLSHPICRSLSQPRWRHAGQRLDDDQLTVAGPGLLDSTRLALSPYDTGATFWHTNADHIENALAAFVQELEHMRENLRTRQLQTEFDRADRAGRSAAQTADFFLTAETRRPQRKRGEV